MSEEQTARKARAEMYTTIVNLFEERKYSQQDAIVVLDAVDTYINDLLLIANQTIRGNQ